MEISISMVAFGSPCQLIIIPLLIIILIFGTKKLLNLGADLGSSFKGFKKAMDGDEKISDEKKQLDADFSIKDITPQKKALIIKVI